MSGNEYNYRSYIHHTHTHRKAYARLFNRWGQFCVGFCTDFIDPVIKAMKRRSSTVSNENVLIEWW